MATPKPAVGPILHPLKTDIVHNRLAIPSPLLVHTVVKKTPQRTEGFEFSRLTLAIFEGWLTRPQRSTLGFRFLTPKYNTSFKKKRRERASPSKDRKEHREARSRGYLNSPTEQVNGLALGYELKTLLSISLLLSRNVSRHSNCSCPLKGRWLSQDSPSIPPRSFRISAAVGFFFHQHSPPSLVLLLLLSIVIIRNHYV
jgi:hypothetical protein